MFGRRGMSFDQANLLWVCGSFQVASEMICAEGIDGREGGGGVLLWLLREWAEWRVGLD